MTDRSIYETNPSYGTYALSPFEHLDAFLSECEQEARKNGWEGDWELQPADLDYLVEKMGRKLTGDEGSYLRISRAFSRHVDWGS